MGCCTRPERRCVSRPRFANTHHDEQRLCLDCLVSSDNPMHAWLAPLLAFITSNCDNNPPPRGTSIKANCNRISAIAQSRGFCSLYSFQALCHNRNVDRHRVFFATGFVSRQILDGIYLPVIFHLWRHGYANNLHTQFAHNQFSFWGSTFHMGLLMGPHNRAFF